MRESSSKPGIISRRRAHSGRFAALAAMLLTTVVAMPAAHAKGAAKKTTALSTSPAATASSASAAQKPAADRIEITSTNASWDNLSELFLGSTPAAPFGEGSVFVMRGELRNKGDKPVRYVVLRYELLDDKGKVLTDAEGFNRSAESMRPDEEGKVRAEEVKSIPAGGVDTYRMVFFHDEVPHFTSQRVRVSEVHLETK